MARPKWRRWVVEAVLIVAAGVAINYALAWYHALTVGSVPAKTFRAIALEWNCPDGSSCIVQRDRGAILDRITMYPLSGMLSDPPAAAAKYPARDELSDWQYRFLDGIVREGGSGCCDRVQIETRGWPLRSLFGVVELTEPPRFHGAIPLGEWSRSMPRFLPLLTLWPHFLLNTAFYSALVLIVTRRKIVRFVSAHRLLVAWVVTLAAIFFHGWGGFMSTALYCAIGPECNSQSHTHWFGLPVPWLGYSHSWNVSQSSETVALRQFNLRALLVDIVMIAVVLAVATAGWRTRRRDVLLVLTGVLTMLAVAVMAFPIYRRPFDTEWERVGDRPHVALYLLILALCMVVLRHGRPRPGIACARCGYSLQGLPSRRCPECGHEP
jgi:hypothetical protein